MSLPRLVHLPACRVGRTGRLLLALRYLISGRFCIIPVGSGIEHFFRNYTAVLRFPTYLPGGGLPARFYAVALSLPLVRCFPLNCHRYRSVFPIYRLIE